MSITYMIVKELSDTLYNEFKLDTPDPAFANSLIYKYWKHNNYQIDKDFTKINPSFNPGDPANTNWVKEYKQQISNAVQFQTYIYNALESVG